MTTKTLDDIDQLFIEAEQIPRKEYSCKIGKVKHIKVRSTLDVAKDNLKKAKSLHKSEIHKLKNTIKSHRLMLKQAKNTYKIVKLSSKIK